MSKPTTQFKTWSVSALRSYEECPRRAKFERLMRLCPLCFKGRLERNRCDKCGRTVSESPALAKGSRVHKEAELYIRGIGPLTPDLRGARKELDRLKRDYKARKVRTELELAFTRAWRLTQWLGPDVYVRFKLDVMHIVADDEVVIKDWKTGQVKVDGNYDDQLQGYAVAALSAGFGDRATGELIFTVNGAKVRRPAGTLSREELPRAQSGWDKRVKAMFADKTFAPRPGYGCRYCPFSVNKGGPCEY